MDATEAEQAELLACAELLCELSLESQKLSTSRPISCLKIIQKLNLVDSVREIKAK